MSTISKHGHNNPVMVPSRKPPDTVKEIYDSQTYDLKTKMYMWTSMDVVPVEYETFAQTFHLIVWFFQFITWINFKWDHVIGCSVVVCSWYPGREDMPEL